MFAAPVMFLCVWALPPPPPPPPRCDLTGNWTLLAGLKPGNAPQTYTFAHNLQTGEVSITGSTFTPRGRLLHGTVHPVYTTPLKMVLTLTASEGGKVVLAQTGVVAMDCSFLDMNSSSLLSSPDADTPPAPDLLLAPAPPPSACSTTRGTFCNAGRGCDATGHKCHCVAHSPHPPIIAAGGARAEASSTLSPPPPPPPPVTCEECYSNFSLCLCTCCTSPLPLPPRPGFPPTPPPSPSPSPSPALPILHADLWYRGLGRFDLPAHVWMKTTMAWLVRAARTPTCGSSFPSLFCA